MRRLSACFCSVLMLGGCTTVAYVERPTPVARIPDAPAIVQPVVQELPRTQPGVMTQESPGVYGDQIALDAGIVRDGVGSSVTPRPQVHDRFAQSYKVAGKPRMAIFLNRQLSDDVREWRTDARLVMTGDGGVSSTTESYLGRSIETVKGPFSASVQTPVASAGKRPDPGESYVWSFEDGFMQPFLREGAILIDRATIMRLTSRTINQGSTSDMIEVKKVEMDALVNKADIFIELLISRYPSAKYGYEFKATAKEVKTGRILANSTSLNWDRSPKQKKKKVVVSDRGYELVDDGGTLPKVHEVSADLAIDLMNSLAAQWARR